LKSVAVDTDISKLIRSTFNSVVGHASGQAWAVLDLSRDSPDQCVAAMTRDGFGVRR
jgi:hypothetical protein